MLIAIGATGLPGSIVVRYVMAHNINVTASVLPQSRGRALVELVIGEAWAWFKPHSYA